MNITEYAQHTGVSQPMITKMIRDGKLGPAAKKLGNKWYFIDEKMADEYVQRNIKVANPEAVNSAALMREARAIREKYMAYLAKLDYEERNKTLIPKRNVDNYVFTCGRKLRDMVQSIPDRCSPLCVGLDQHQIRINLQSEINNILNELVADFEKMNIDRILTG